MSVIANLTSNAADATNYSNIAHDYISQWQTLGIAHDANPPHTTLNYGANDSFSKISLMTMLLVRMNATDNTMIDLLYNLYGDKELNLGLVPQSVYDMQSAFYPTVAEEYGVPLDTRHDYAKSRLRFSFVSLVERLTPSTDDEAMLAAGTTSANTTALIIGDIAKWINESPTNRAMTDLYNATGGE